MFIKVDPISLVGQISPRSLQGAIALAYCADASDKNGGIRFAIPPYELCAPGITAVVYFAVRRMRFVQRGTAVILLESEGRGDDGRARPVALMKQIVLNPMVLSTLMGLVWQSRACRCRRCWS